MFPDSDIQEPTLATKMNAVFWKMPGNKTGQRRGQYKKDKQNYGAWHHCGQGGRRQQTSEMLEKDQQELMSP